MRPDRQVNQLITVGIIAVYAVLAFVGTTLIRVPLPATGGYFNLGDTFVYAAALLHGPIVGGAVGLIGPATADAIGYPQFILATAAVKGLEGLMVGAVGHGPKTGASRVVTALILGIIILAGGYYLFEALIYPQLAKTVPFYGVTDANAALLEIVPNLLQGVISAVIAFGIWKVLGGRSQKSEF